MGHRMLNVNSCVCARALPSLKTSQDHLISSSFAPRALISQELWRLVLVRDILALVVWMWGDRLHVFMLPWPDGSWGSSALLGWQGLFTESVGEDGSPPSYVVGSLIDFSPV